MEKDSDMEKHNDPFSFIFDLCQISPSQEQLLRLQPFVGENVDPPSPSSTAAAATATATGDVIFMMSMPQTQYPAENDASAPKDQEVFLTPQEKSLSLPISGDDPFDNVSQFVDLRGDSDATVYVDLGRDSDLGFSDVQLTQVIQEELIDGSSRGTKRGAVGDKCNGFERELDSNEKISESAMKKLKLSDSKSGFESPRAYLGIQSQKGKEKLRSDAKTPFCNVEKGSEKNNIKLPRVFDVLKFLSDNCNNDDGGGDGVENFSLLEAFKKRGLTFPRPRWWPENDSFRRGRILTSSKAISIHKKLRTMRKEGNKESKFKHYILTPIKILKGVTACAGSGADDGVVQISHLDSSRENGDERHREVANNTFGRNYCMVQNNISNNNMTSSTFKHVACCCPEHGSGPCNNLPKTRAAMHGETTTQIRNSVGNQTRMVMHGEKVLKIRNNNAGKETMVVMHSHGQRQPNFVGYKYNRKKMSYYSDGVKKMERIDEDKPCSFEEDQNNFNKAHLLYIYPRTRPNTSSGKK